MDIMYILVPLILMYISQWYINSTYQKYKLEKNIKNLTGYEVTKKILENNKINDIKILKTEGTLTDHFDPKNKVIRLSEDIYNGNTIASISVAAHEVGHVIQYKNSYLPLKIRSLLVPLVNFSSQIGYVMFVIGMASAILNIVYIGLLLMSGSLIFQLITLPVEFNASKRAKQSLYEGNMITKDELHSVDKMLKSAAFTYLASFFITMMQIVRLLNIANRKR